MATANSWYIEPADGASTSCYNAQVNGENILGGEEGEFFIPPGHRFVPTDHELIESYLLSKILCRRLPCNIINHIDSLHTCDPWKLPIRDFTHGRENEAYFFTHVDWDYSPEEQIKKTENGYWKSFDGADDLIYRNNQTIGYKKTYLFNTNEETEGEKECWMLFEYRVHPDLITPEEFDDAVRANMSCVLCKVQCIKQKAHDESAYEGEEEPEDSM